MKQGQNTPILTMDATGFYTKQDREMEKLSEEYEKQSKYISTIEQSLIEAKEESKMTKIEISDLKTKTIRTEELEKENEALNNEILKLKNNLITTEGKLKNLEITIKKTQSKKSHELTPEGALDIFNKKVAIREKLKTLQL